MKSYIIAAVIGSALLSIVSAQGIDRVVDASGQTSIYTNISQAMAVSSAGDRILVLPGSYPTFQFTHGVRVLGMGDDPSDVVVERVAYHPSIPNIGYETVLSNMTLESSNPLDVIVLGGNELAPGSLVLEGVHLKGGVFLRGGQAGFYCLMSNCLVEPPPGYGVNGEACFIGGPGNFFEIRNSRIKGWDADPSIFMPAGLGLRIGGGTQMRIVNSRINGGAGAVGATGIFANGAAAIQSQAPGNVQLLLTGGSLIHGGDAAAGGVGGHGVTLSGTIDLEGAAVTGGTGTPAGQAFSVAQPQSAAALGMFLDSLPAKVDAAGDVAVHSGETLAFSVPSNGQFSVIAINVAVRLPSGIFVPIVTEDAILEFSDTWSVVVPNVPPGIEFPGLFVFAQGAVLDAMTNQLVPTNTVAMRIDLN